MKNLKCFLIICIVFNLLCRIAVCDIFPGSIENKLEEAPSDTAKVMVYNDFARILINGQVPYYDLALRFAQQGLELAEEIQFTKGIAELHRTNGIACFYLNEYEQAIYHYRKAADLCEKMHNIHELAQNYYNINLVYRAQTKIYNSLDYLLKALLLWRQSGNTEEALSVYKDIIQLYQTVEEYHVAMDYTLQAVQLAQETGNRSEEASLYDMLARINISVGNIWAVEEYYDLSIKIYEELDDQLQIARITQNMAANLYSNDFEKMMELLRKAASIYERLTPSNSSLYTIYNNISILHQSENQLDSAIYYKEKALNKAVFSGNPQTIASAFCSVGKFYMQIDITTAEDYFQKAYETAWDAGLIHMQAEALYGLSSVRYLNRDYSTSLQYLNKYQVIKDSMTIEDNRRNLQKLTMQYDFEKAEKEKKGIIKAQLEQQQQAIRQQQAIVVITSFALALTIILLGFVYRSNRLNKRTNVMLERQHSEILNFNEELQTANQELFTYKDHLEEMVKEQTARLRQSEIQLRNLSDHLPGGCIYRKHIFHDGKEMISYVSNTVDEWLGLSAETIIGDIQTFYRQIVTEDLKRKQQLEQENLATMTPYSCEYRMMKGTQEVWLLESTMPHPDKKRDIVCDAIVVDITARKKFERELIQARERAEESGMLKSSFLANMSHEIRTPMNGILGFLSFIGREDLSTEKRLTYTRIIRSNIQQLLQLIGDIIDISKIDSHQLSLHNITFDLNNLLIELEIFFQDFILKKDKKMELILDREGFVTPCALESDPVRLRQMLTNLVGNAVKFTEKGYIRFGYRLAAKRTKLLFFVEDTGIGIQPSKQRAIFNRYEQEQGEETRSTYGGTGLGLAISKNIVEMMGGQIGVRSKAGEGSTFYFTLPVSNF